MPLEREKRERCGGRNEKWETTKEECVRTRDKERRKLTM